MPIEDENFCKDGYKEIDGLDALIEAPLNDPNFFQFLSNYKLWEAAGAPSGLADMFTFFEDTGDSERALLAGDLSEGNEEGRVRQAHCEVHRNFVLEGRPISALFAQRAAEADPAYFTEAGATVRDLTAFESALRAFIQGEELNAQSRGLLNGAVFLYRKPPTSGFTGGKGQVSKDEEEFIAIPGRLVTQGLFRRDLRDIVWNGVLKEIKDASDTTGMKSINIDLALQLRLGQRDDSPFPSQSVGSGVIIFGGE